MKLNHLIFADDLILFCKADSKSIKVLADVLTEFEQTSGLLVSNAKSPILIGGGDKDQLIQESGFAEGSLPFKYLGGSITPSRLSKSDCSLLVDKLTARVKSWSGRNLSYAGRIMLINTVLMGVISFWCHIFILPQHQGN